MKKTKVKCEFCGKEIDTTKAILTPELMITCERCACGKN